MFFELPPVCPRRAGGNLFVHTPTPNCPFLSENIGNKMRDDPAVCARFWEKMCEMCAFSGQNMLSEASNVIFVDFNNVFGRQCINLKEQKADVLAK